MRATKTARNMFPNTRASTSINSHAIHETLLDVQYLQNHRNPIKTLQYLQGSRFVHCDGVEEFPDRVQFVNDLLEP